MNGQKQPTRPASRSVYADRIAPTARGLASGIARPRVLVVIALVIFVLAYFLSGKYPPEVVCLIAIALLALGVLTAYFILERYVPKMGAALLESQEELFLRLEGLFTMIPKEILDGPENRSTADQFRSLHGRILGLRDEQHHFKSDLASDLVHNLHLIYLQLAPLEFLRLLMIPLREEFRDAVGATFYNAYHSSPAHQITECSTDAVELARALRADATFLANQTRRHLLLKTHVETARQDLIKGAMRGWWSNAVPLIAILLFYFFCQHSADRVIASHRESRAVPRLNGVPAFLSREVTEQIPPPGPTASKLPAKTKGDRHLVKVAETFLLLDPAHQRVGEFTFTPLYQVVMAAALLAMVGMAGATGGTLSVIQRIQSVAGNANPNEDLRNLSQCGTAVFFAPVIGFLFAVILAIIFAGHFISGQLFPDIPKDQVWYFAIWNGAEIPKWVFWGFLAGFSERLVPDMLNSISKQALEQSTRAPATSLPTDRTVAEVNLQNAGDATAVRPVRPVQPFQPQPTLNTPADPILHDATEFTVTGSGLTTSSKFTIGGRELDPTSVLDVFETSARLRIEPADILGTDAVEVSVTNPPPGGGTSGTIIFTVSDSSGD